MAQAVGAGVALRALKPHPKLRITGLDPAVRVAIGDVGALHVAALRAAAHGATHWKEPAADKAAWGEDPALAPLNGVAPGLPAANTASVVGVVVVPPQAQSFMSVAAEAVVAPWVMKTRFGVMLHGDDFNRVVDDAEPLRYTINAAMGDATAVATGRSGARVVVVLDPSVDPAAVGAVMTDASTLVVAASLTTPPLTLVPFTAMLALRHSSKRCAYLLSLAVGMLRCGDDAEKLAPFAEGWARAVGGLMTDPPVPKATRDLLEDEAEVAEDFAAMASVPQLVDMAAMPLPDLTELVVGKLQRRQIQIAEPFGSEVVSPFSQAPAKPPAEGLFAGAPWPAPSLWFLRPTGDVEAVSCAGLAVPSWSCGRGWRTADEMAFVEVAQGVVLGVVTTQRPRSKDAVAKAAREGMLKGGFRREAVALVTVADVEYSVVAHRWARHSATQRAAAVAAGDGWEHAATDAKATAAAAEEVKRAAAATAAAMDLFMQTPDGITAGVTEAVIEGIQVQREKHHAADDAMVRNMDKLSTFLGTCKGMLAYTSPDTKAVPEASMGATDPMHPNRMGPGRHTAPFHQLVSRVLAATATVMGRSNPQATPAHVPSAPGANLADMHLVANTDFVALMYRVRDVADDLEGLIGLPPPEEVSNIAEPPPGCYIPQFLMPDAWAHRFMPELSADVMVPHEAHRATAVRFGIMEDDAAVDEEADGDVLDAAKHVLGAGGDAAAAALMMDGAAAHDVAATDAALATAEAARQNVVRVVQDTTTRSTMANAHYARAEGVAAAMRRAVAAARKYLQQVETRAQGMLARWKRVLFSKNMPVVVVVATCPEDVPAMLAGTSAALWLYGRCRRVDTPFWDPTTAPGRFQWTPKGWADATRKAYVPRGATPAPLDVVATFARGMHAAGVRGLDSPRKLLWGLTHTVHAKGGSTRQHTDMEPPVVVAAAHLSKILASLQPGTATWTAVATRGTRLQHAFTVVGCMKRVSLQRAARAALDTRAAHCNNGLRWMGYVRHAARGGAAAAVAAMQRASLALQCMGAFAVPDVPPLPPPPSFPPAPSDDATPQLKAELVRRMAARAPRGLRVPLVPGTVLNTGLPSPVALDVAAMARNVATVAIVADVDVNAVALGKALPVVATASVNTPTVSGALGGAVATSPNDGKLTPAICRSLSVRGVDVDAHGHIVWNITTTTTPRAVITARVLYPGRVRSAPNLAPVSTAQLVIRPTWAPVKADPRRCVAKLGGGVATSQAAVDGLVTVSSACVPAAALHTLSTMCNTMHTVGRTYAAPPARDWWTQTLQCVPVVLDGGVTALVGGAARVSPQALAGLSVTALSHTTHTVFRDLQAALPRDQAATRTAHQLMELLPQWRCFLAAMAAVLRLDAPSEDPHADLAVQIPVGMWGSLRIVREAAVFYALCLTGVATAAGLTGFASLWGSPVLAAVGTSLDAVQPGMATYDDTAATTAMRRALYWGHVQNPGGDGFVPAGDNVATTYVNVRVWAPGAWVPSITWAAVRSEAKDAPAFSVAACTARLVDALENAAVWAAEKQYAVWVVARQPGTTVVDVSLHVGFAANDIKGMDGGCPVAYVTPMVGGGEFSAVGAAHPNPAFRPDSVLIPTYNTGDPRQGCTATATLRSHTCPMAVAAVFVTDVTALAPMMAATPAEARAVAGLTAATVGTITKALRGEAAPVAEDARTKWAHAKHVVSTACRAALQGLAENALPVVGKTTMNVGATGVPMCVMFSRMA